MANRRDYFFKQKVQSDELNAGFQGLEDADRALVTDSAFFGITFGLEVQQASPTPNLTVRVLGPGAGFDQTGERCAIPSTQSVNVAVDSLSSPTAVVSSGNEKIVSVSIAFQRALSDPRIDGNSVTVYFVQDESFEFVVTQGAEGPHPATPPAKLSSGLLLADITRTFGQTAIHNSDISIARRDDQIVVDGMHISEIRAGTFGSAFTQLVAALDAFVGGSAALIGYTVGPNWADGTTNPASDVETELNHIISVLATGAGTAKIMGAAHTDSPNSLIAERLDQQLNDLLSFINDRLPLTGGTLTGDVLSSVSGAQNLGSALKRFAAWLTTLNVSGAVTFLNTLAVSGAVNLFSTLITADSAIVARLFTDQNDEPSPQANAIYAGNVAKASGCLKTNGSSGLSYSRNFGNVGFMGIQDDHHILVTLETEMDTTHYGVEVSGGSDTGTNGFGGGPLGYNIVDRQNFQIFCQSGSNFNTDIGLISFRVYGVQ